MRQSLSTGLSRTLDLTVTFTQWTRPFFSGNTSTIFSRGHKLRCEHPTATSTTSPTAMFLLGRSHFCLLWRRGIYSFDDLFQKITARYWTCFHLLRDSRSSLWNRRGGIGDSDRSSNKWLSTSLSKVVRLSWSMICSWRRAGRIFLVVRMQRCQTPP